MQAASGESDLGREKVFNLEFHGQNQEQLYQKLNGYRYNGEKNFKNDNLRLLITKYQHLRQT